MIRNTPIRKNERKSKSWHYIVYGYWFTLCLFDKVLGSWFLIKIKEGYTWFQRIEYGVPRWQVWKRVVQICLSRFPLVINTGIHKSCIIVWCCCYGLKLYSEYHIALYGSWYVVLKIEIALPRNCCQMGPNCILRIIAKLFFFRCCWWGCQLVFSCLTYGTVVAIAVLHLRQNEHSRQEWNKRREGKIFHIPVLLCTTDPCCR